MNPLDRLRARHAREKAVRDRNDAARHDIRLGKQRGWVMREHSLSVTAFEQLAGQVRTRHTGGATR